MILFVVAVFDRATGAYARPVFVPALGAAVRSFQDEVNRPAEGNDLNKHPEDFALYQLASFDDNDGRFVSLDSPKLLVNGSASREK